MRRAPKPTAAPAGAPGVEGRLIATASELFYKEGVRAVGIQRVIEEAGVAKASLYAHFASKDDLVAACLDTRISTWLERVDAHLRDAALDARGTLLALFDLQVAWIASAEFRGCPLQSVASEIAAPDHPAKRIIAKHRQWLHDLITALATEARLEPLDEVVGALVVLYDGASAAALVDGRAVMGSHARWAVERLIDASRPTPSPRRRAPAARASRKR